MRILWLAAALDDLDAIYEYIATDNPEAAGRVFSRIIQAVRALSDTPHRGRPGRWRSTRELVIARTPYVVPYRVRADVIEILRVFHGARRWPDKPSR
jgi:toxin ParE1/3/4